MENILQFDIVVEQTNGEKKNPREDYYLNNEIVKVENNPWTLTKNTYTVDLGPNPLWYLPLEIMRSKRNIPKRKL